MTNIFLLGSSTRTGEYINLNYKDYFENGKIYCFSSKKNSNYYLDLKNHIIPPGIPFDKEFIIISLAPIWLFVPYLESLLKKNKVNRDLISGIIVTSSTSVITKKYSWNIFDNNLYKKLSLFEKKLINLSTNYKFALTIIRPTLIYDDIGRNSDKNISTLLKLMKKTLILPLPDHTGLRQPLHFSQLGESILNISKSYKLDKKNKSYNIINLGGDEELTYQEILNRLKKSFPASDSINNCIFIKIPNRLFFLLCMPILIFSPKLFEAIQRITINMHGFSKSYEVSGSERKKFPVKSKI